MLLKTICGFLNSNGGIILIGVFERKDYIYTVLGSRYTSKQKEEIRAELIDRIKRIYPPVYSSNRIEVEFVPVRGRYKDGKAVEEVWIARIRVEPGERNRVYMVTGEENGFYFRVESSVLVQKTEHAY